MVSVAVPINIINEQGQIHIEKDSQIADGASFESLDDTIVVDSLPSKSHTTSSPNLRKHILAVQQELSNLKLLTTPPSSSPSDSSSPSSPSTSQTIEPSPEPATLVLPTPSIKETPPTSILRRPTILTAPKSPDLQSLKPKPKAPSMTVRQARACLTTSDVEGLMKDKQDHISHLRQKHEKLSQEQNNLEQFWKDVNDMVKQQVPSSSTAQKSSANRMQEERERKRLLAEWKRGNPDVTIDQQRRDILAVQQDLADIRQDILAAQKEISDLKLLAAQDISSHLIMRTAMQKRLQEGKKVINIEQLPPLPFLQPPPQPPQRSHLTRMQEQKANKEKARGAQTSAMPHAKGPTM